MPCPYARFVIHYLDGTTIHEDRSDKYCWDNAPNKQDIIAMGIQFDPLLLYFPNAKDEKGKPLPIVDPVSKVHLKEHYAEPVLKGSKKYYYGFFQMKDALRRGRRPSKVLSLMVGRVVDNFPWIHPDTGEPVLDKFGNQLLNGHCEVMFGPISRQPKTFYTTVRHLGFIDDISLQKQGIILEDCGKLRTEINIKPPIDVIGEEIEIQGDDKDGQTSIT
ncbi:hypothetical protein KAR91_56915 [Candidatus Pacearchaeota archaeon]|nr:hypothetical protein [Candidatus Pacearchaeota archaeon]